MRTLGLIAALLGIGFVWGGCFDPFDPLSGHACTDIGCIDQFHVRVANPDGSFPAGTHVLEVTTADGVQRSCTFALPPQTVDGGAILSPLCPTGLQVFNDPLQTCTTSSSSTSMSQSCAPIAGTVQERITVDGTSATLRLRQTVDGVVVFDRTVMPIYDVSQPNGPGCEPICHQASAEWTFSTPL
jgi:hypothetical protein